MCGILGVISDHIENYVIEDMVLSLKHRGPDASGISFLSERTCALGHTRLSIIDLSTDANQPFLSDDKRYALVFNGEIYNFLKLKTELIALGRNFRTQSDTEVVLQSYLTWGQSCPQRFEGMFAFAVYDTITKTIFIARDRMGKKPLFYYQDAGLFVFASELKGVLKYPAVNKLKRINEAAIRTFLHLGYIPEPKTIYENIHKLPSGSSAFFKLGASVTPQKYWNIQDLINVSSARVTHYEKSCNDLFRLLEESVSKRLISDVPLGVFLSGGTDSSLVTAIASTLVNPVRTFSIGFNERKFNETENARKVAHRLKTDHHEFILTEQKAALQLESVMDNFDEPFADTSAIPTHLVSNLARQKVKVALTGDGGDELFLGYGSYAWANRLNNPFFQSTAPLLAGILSAASTDRFQRAGKLLNTNKVTSLRSHIFSQEQYFFSEAEIRSKLLLKKGHDTDFQYHDPAIAKHLTGAEKQALFDLQFYLRDDLLVKVDRASMMTGLECRSPFLDHHVIEYALNLPFSFKWSGKHRKRILKDILRKFLPDEYIDKTKWGFGIPLADWLRGDLRYLMDDYLNDNAIEETGLFEPGYVNELKKQFLGGRQYFYNRLWVLICVQRWMKKNG